MVLESLTSPALAEKRPGELFFLGALFSSVALLLAVWIFEEHAGLVMVFLTVTAALPLFYHTMKYEEEKDLKIASERTLLEEHARAVKFFIFFFAGVTLSLATWYVLLPADFTSAVFRVQSQTIATLNQQVVQGAHGTGAAINAGALFGRIFLNNTKVMFFALLFSFIYGYGALFILTWNASVIATAMGNFIRSRLASVAGGGIHNYFAIGSLGILRYALHGIPEIAAYFVAALAGGIFSAALVRGDLAGPKARRILLDCADLVIIALVILLLAAAVEVYVTPLFF